MDQNGITNLLNAVCANYPNVRRGFEKDGEYIQYVIDEWQRQLGFLDYDEALKRLDAWMATDAGAKAPKPADLRKSSREGKIEYFHAEINHQWHLEFMKWDTEQMHGRLFDEEDREYVHDPRYEDGYHYNQMGLICTVDGMVAV